MTHSSHTRLLNPSYGILCLSATLFYSAYHVLSPVIPVFLEKQHLSGLAIGSLVALFMIASLVVRPWVGKFSDELDKKRLMMAGLGLFTLASGLYLVADNLVFLTATRILHGVGFALFVTTSYGYLVTTLPAQHKGEGIGYYSSAIKVAMAIAPASGVWLLSHLPLPSAFWTSLVLCALTGLCVLSLPVLSPPPQSTRMPGKLFNTSACFPGLVMATNSIAFGALIPYIPLIAAEKSLAQPGWFYTVYAVFLIASRTLTGRLSDKYGRDVVLIPGLLCVTATLTLLALTQNDILFLLATALYGLAAGTVQPSLIALTTDRTRTGEQGSAMATFTMFTDLGIAAGMFLMGLLGQSLGYGSGLLWIAFVSLIGFAVFTSLTLLRGKAHADTVPCEVCR